MRDCLFSGGSASPAVVIDELPRQLLRQPVQLATFSRTRVVAASSGLFLTPCLMKPLLFVVTALTSSSALFTVSQLSGYADSQRVPPPPLLAALSTPPEYIWVPLAADSELSSISRELDLSLSELAEINDKSSSALLKAGSWLVLPKSSQEQVLDSSRFLGDNLRASAPLSAPPALQDTVEIQPNQSLASLVRDHGISIEKLRSLNPGIELSKLTIGSKVRVANAQPLLAVRPLQSGGASWPQLPNFGDLEGFGENQSYAWPTKGVFTSGYGWRWGRMHKGIDIANNVGTPIHAAKSGLITFSGWSSGGYGYMVEIAHPDGSKTRYAHNSRLLVKKGQLVPQGSKISLMGSTGRSTGPHLHFEIRRAGGAALDPMALLPARRA